MDTFGTARLKLTAWYLVIIMALSLSFSAFIFRALTAEVRRFESAQRFLFERSLEEGQFVPQPDRQRIVIRNGLPMNPELIEETKRRILLMLVFANSGVLIVTSGLGFFLAGRTLKPIREMLDEQNRFITDASHELKTPLTSLRAEYEAAMLEENKLTKKDLLGLVKSSSEEIVNLHGLAEKLMELTQQKKQKETKAFQAVSLLETIELAINRVIPLARQKRITIDNQVDDHLLEAEAQNMVELFVILLDNAIKYSPKNSKITLKSEKINHQIQIEVIDQGIGIDTKDLPYIFDRFWRADKSRSRVKGFGLGLSIAEEIVAKHKGKISAKSKLGKGTVFSIRFPETRSS